MFHVRGTSWLSSKRSAFREKAYATSHFSLENG